MHGLLLGGGMGGSCVLAEAVVAGYEVGEHGSVDVLLDLHQGDARDLHLKVQDVQLVLRTVAFLDCRVEF